MNLVEYLKETRAEVKHVSFPTKKQSILFTSVVIALSVGVGVFLGLFDYLLTYLIQNFL